MNGLRAVKPGATVLLNGVDERRRDQVVLASQRYGRGKAIAFPIQDSWLWQMHASMSLEDQTHENYWRQMLRWLVDDEAFARLKKKMKTHNPSAAEVSEGRSVGLAAAGQEAVVAGVVDAIDFIEANADEAKSVTNAGIEAVTDKPLPQEVIDAAWENLTFTVDPIAPSLAKSSADTEAVGLQDPVDLEGIYDLTFLNEVLAEKGDEEVKGL